MARIALILALCVSAIGCGNADSGHSKKNGAVSNQYSGAYPIKVVCTTGMIADLVRNVGGKHVAVEEIFGADIDPHTYKPTEADVRKIGQADIVFYNGLHLEGKMGDIFDRMSRKIPTFAVAEMLDDSKLLHDEDDAHDPHVWFNVEFWREAAGIIGSTLSKFDPKNADNYKAKLEPYQGQLTKLHAWAKEQIGSIPTDQRVLITSHDAFQYFGKAYGIQVKGIQGISTDTEASVKDIGDLVTFLTKNKVKAVFVETSVNQRNMQSLIEGCKANNHTVTIGGELFSDAMGKDGTYIGMIEHNVNTIVKALR